MLQQSCGNAKAERRAEGAAGPWLSWREVLAASHRRGGGMATIAFNWQPDSTLPGRALPGEDFLLEEVTFTRGREASAGCRLEATLEFQSKVSSFQMVCTASSLNLMVSYKPSGDDFKWLDQAKGLLIPGKPRGLFYYKLEHAFAAKPIWRIRVSFLFAAPVESLYIQSLSLSFPAKLGRRGSKSSLKSLDTESAAASASASSSSTTSLSTTPTGSCTPSSSELGLESMASQTGSQQGLDESGTSKGEVHSGVSRTSSSSSSSHRRRKSSSTGAGVGSANGGGGQSAEVCGLMQVIDCVVASLGSGDQDKVLRDELVSLRRQLDGPCTGDLDQCIARVTKIIQSLSVSSSEPQGLGGK